jgi:hypothetical protein
MNSLAFAAFLVSFKLATAAKATIAALIAASAALFGTTITAPTPGPLVPTASPDSDTAVGQAANLPFQYEVLTGTTDVIQGGGGGLGSVNGGAAAPICGTSFIETAGVDAATLAVPAAGAPSAGGNDGLEITIVDNSGHAHTVTAPANSIVPAHHLLTFNGTRGSFVTLVARNGVWIPLASSGVTPS